MSTLWQLRKLSTNENLSEPQPLPENWGPIFGLSGFKDRLGDLSWCDCPDQGWFDTGVAIPLPATVDQVDEAEKVKKTALQLLSESDWAMMPDVPMTAGKKSEWEAYRKALREIKLQPDFPNVSWPSKP